MKSSHWHSLLSVSLCILLMQFISCSITTSPKLMSERQKQDISREFSKESPEALTLQADSLYKIKNWEKATLAYRELGKKLRKSSLFNESVDAHMRGLEAASVIHDTIEIIQAYNNIGTNYRRMGILDEASNFHYRALELCDSYSDTTSYSAQKNLTVSLNGLGNVNLTLGNDDIALQAFRRALEGERLLGSDLGVAINYANIGSILEEQGKVDSALIYYNLSMSHNVAANSKLGISLCHNHLGRIAENRGDLQKAYDEYLNSYHTMKNEVDQWHWLESTVQLMRICLKMGKMQEFQTYVQESEPIAQAINSAEHLVQIFQCKSEYYERLGDMKAALENHKKSDGYLSQIYGDQTRNQIQNVRINYVRNKGIKELELAKKAYQNEERSKRYIFYFMLTILLFSISTVIMLLYMQKLRAKKNQTLHKASEMQQTFFTNVTHEFRTPLTVILGLARHYEDIASSPREKEDMKVIVRQGNSLLHLVNQLLDIAKVRSAVGNPDWRTGDLVALVHMSVESIASFASGKFIDIEVVCKDYSLKMDFVPEYMMKILHNLLSNAIKFTDKGGSVVVDIQTDNKTVQISVSDTGCGIEEQNIEHIFDSFYQVQSGSGNIEYYGSGIGLAMVEQMILAMNGKVDVQSKVGQGTTITITMPQYLEANVHGIWMPDNSMKVKDESLETACIHAVKEEENLEHISEKEIVLVVEDKADLAHYIGSVLENDYVIKYASDGKDGLSKAEEFVPDIILTDVMMPQMDGFELCDTIRKSDILNHIPIIVITAKNTEKDKLNALSKGADAFLIKPFNADELKLRVYKLLEQRRLLRDKFSAEMISDNEKMTSSEIMNQDKTFLMNLHKGIYAHISDSTFGSEKLADHMCMSRSQLNRKIKMITGLDTTSYIRQARIQYAYKLIVTTDEQIGNIIEMSGFEYRSYFNKVFKQKYGVTPAQCRLKRKKP